MLRQISEVTTEGDDVKYTKAKDGDFVWIPDDKEGFVTAEIIESLDKVAVVQTKSGDHARVQWNKTFPMNPPSQNGEDDNTKLMHLHEASLLGNIRYRYDNSLIYTYTAGILIVVNPYKLNDPLYSKTKMLEYKGKSIGLLPPHTFAIADRAFRSMKALDINQSIIVSGESGAGKTETCKHVIRFLTTISSDSSGDEQSLERQILETGVILECFGNAVTVRNNNSSRFGKFSELVFDKNQKVCGASIETYLLEKSRVVGQAIRERNYHSFYQLLAGANEDMRARFHLDTTAFHYLSHFSEDEHQIDDHGDFLATQKALQIIGLTEQERDNVWRVIAGILHMGNIEFRMDRQDRAQVKTDSDALKISAELLGLDLARFEKMLTTRSIVVRGQKPIISPLRDDQAVFSRDALAKDIYGRLFDWIVTQLNAVLVPDRERVKNHIGILDIFGFEVFQHNSFEQLCINYANERLQLFFNSQVLQAEMDLYQREGIQFSPIQVTDNRPTLNLFEGRTGLMSMLDEECVLPKGTSQAFTDKLHRTHSDHPSVMVPRRAKRTGTSRRLRDDEGFAVKHFAGEVVYETDGFLQKNNDALLHDLEDLMQSTSNEFLQNLFPPPIEDDTRTKKPKKFKSVGSKFTQQLQSLLNHLGTTSSHFIRCIKPNSLQKPGIFEGMSVMSQLRCSGMVECLILLHSGFPTRCSFEDLYNRYRDVVPAAVSSLQPAEFCEALLIALDIDRREFQLGITKVFLRAGQLAALEELNSSEYKEIAQDVAEKVRKWLARKRLKRAIYTVIGFLRFKTALRQLRAIERISRFARMVFLITRSWIKLARKIKRISATKKIQSTFRMYVTRKDYHAVRAKATKIQAMIRGHQIYRLYFEERRQMKIDREEMKRQRELEDKRKREEAKQRREQARKQKEEDERDARQRQIDADRQRAKERIRRMEERRQEKAAPAPVATPMPTPVATPIATEPVISSSHLTEIKQLIDALKADFNQSLDMERERREEESVRTIKAEMRFREIESDMKQLRQTLDEEIECRKKLEQQVKELQQAQKMAQPSTDEAMFEKMERLGLRVKGRSRDRSSSMQVQPRVSRLVDTQPITQPISTPIPAPIPAPRPLYNREALTSLQTAVTAIVQHFKVQGNARSAGDDEIDKRIIGLVRGGLCTAIYKVFSWGFNSYKFFGRYHVIDVFEGLKLDNAKAGSPAHSLTRAIAVVESIHKSHGGKDMRFRSVICRGLNEQRLHEWISLFNPRNQAIVAKLYQMTTSFFTIEEARNELSHMLMPLAKLPFSLSLDFEIRRWDL